MYSGNVTNCNLTNNSARFGGGAVYSRDDGKVTNCNFTNNAANGDGGAVYLYNAGNVTNSNLPSEVNLKIEFYEKVSQFLKNEHFTG